MAKQTILIVEDDLKVVELVKTAIKKIGMEYNIKIKNRNGRIFFQEGKVVDIETDGVPGEEALTGFLDPTFENTRVGIEYLEHHRKKKMNKSFTQVILDASRLNDEKKKKEINTQDETINIDTGEPHRHLEKEAKIDHQQLNSLIENLKKELGDALVSTAIWTVPAGRLITGYNTQENVSHALNHITLLANETLTRANYPGLGKYFIFDLKDEKTIGYDSSWPVFLGYANRFKPVTAGIPVKRDPPKTNCRLRRSNRMRRECQECHI